MSLDRLRALRSDLEKCFRCSLCKMVPLPVVRHPEFTDACPAARLYHFHGFSGSGKQIMALSLLDGRIAPDAALSRIAFACTACGYCDVACKFIMDAERHRVNMTLREYLAELGLSPEAFTPVITALQQHGRPNGVPPLSSSSHWAEGLGLKTAPGEKAEALLFAGCAAMTEPGPVHSSRRLARLLLHAGLDCALLESEPCCGLPAYWMNQRALFTQLARQTIEILESTGARKLITLCGACLGVFRSKYGEYMRPLQLEVLHASEILASLIRSGRLALSRPLTGRVTYHDPCYLGRQSEPPAAGGGEEKIALGVMTYTDPPKKLNYGSEGVFAPPREILEAIPGLELREMYRIREYSFCCGAGGGVPAAYPELARNAVEHRLEEARAVGAEKLVTACWHCESQFRRAQDDLPVEKRLPVADLIDLVFEAAGLEG